MKNPKFYTPENVGDACSIEEWNTCLKVLDLVSREVKLPHDAEPLERLIAGLQKKIRKRNRRESYQEKRQADKELIDDTVKVSSANQKSGTTSAKTADPSESAFSTLNRQRRCYICRAEYRKLHFHYHRLCPACAKFNYSKRSVKIDLTGRKAIVTGARTKIGYQTALRLLRSGASVIATTRFSYNAAQRYAAEPDFEQWQDRLEIHRLDFRNPLSVTNWANQLIHKRVDLNILIHNAAQTVWRPEIHYDSLIKLESEPVQALKQPVRKLIADAESTLGIDDQTSKTDLSQLMVASPFEEPEDRREVTSWNLRLEDVETIELLEVLLINSTAPFILNSKLKPLLAQSSFPDRYIVNVTGKDGRFTVDDKTTGHPHVNMSKAALNMMTRTSAEEFAEKSIFMNSVDTGWVTLEGGYTKRQERQAEGFITPLDAIDAAARICFPVVEGALGKPQFGKLFKDYEPADW